MCGFLRSQGSRGDESFLAVRACCVQTPLVGLVYAFATFLYHLQILLKDDHEINWIVSVAILYSNTELRRQVQWQCLGINSVCCRIRAVLCSSGAIIKYVCCRIRAVLCSSGAIVV